MRSEDLSLRPAGLEDAEALAGLYLDAREAAFPAVPRGVHPPDDVRRWMRSHLSVDAPTTTEVWVAEEPGALLGLLLLQESWLHSLYVAPGRTGAGIGTALLDLAKARRPRGLGLWVFVSNQRAQRFYERHGFVEVQRTDGTGPDGNEEQQPDVEMAWPDPDSLAGLRARIDALDDRLADVLAERAATTARIQQLKPVPGHAGRDAAREQEIVDRVSTRAPALGEDRVRRIMQVVIGESLDAAEGRAPAPDPPPAPAEEDPPPRETT